MTFSIFPAMISQIPTINTRRRTIRDHKRVLYCLCTWRALIITLCIHMIRTFLQKFAFLRKSNDLIIYAVISDLRIRASIDTTIYTISLHVIKIIIKRTHNRQTLIVHTKIKSCGANRNTSILKFKATNRANNITINIIKFIFGNKKA